MEGHYSSAADLLSRQGPDDELPPDLDDLDWGEEDAPARQRGSYTGVMMRHPLMLLLVIGLGVFTITRSLPAAELYFADPGAVDYGDMLERPEQRSEGKTPKPFVHGQFATLSGTVISLATLYQAARSDDPPGAPGSKYFTKVAGDNLFLVVDASREDVQAHYDRVGRSLVGFEFREQGRLINPAEEPLYSSVDRTIRLKYNIKDDEPVWLFDTTDSPDEYLSHVIIIGFSGLVILVALFGLLRYWRRRSA